VRAPLAMRLLTFLMIAKDLIPGMGIKVFAIMKMLLLALLSAITSTPQVNFLAPRDAYGDRSRYCVPFSPESGGKRHTMM
jgi:hypothetical protein